MKMRRTAVAVSAALLVAMAGASGMAHAQSGAAAAASGASGASAPAAALPVVGQYTIRPGQSLHDVAVDVTQSHDNTVLARASQALFDANPSAFMKRDPSRLKVGAVLNVPGTPDMASAAAGASAPVAAASAPGAAAAAVAGASSVADAVASASASTTAAAAAAGASTGANTGALAASSAAGASAPEASASAASAQPVSAASAEAGTGAAPAPASDPHSWSGAVQAPPSAAVSGASATPGSAASTPTVSSLQQLLALKNRVLMALQQHGIGKPAQVAGAPAGAQGNAAAGGVAPGANGAQPEVSPVTLGGVAALVLAFVALIVRVLMRKRRKPAPEASESAVEPPLAARPTERDDAPAQPAAPLATSVVAAAAAVVEAKAEAPTEQPPRDAVPDHAVVAEPGGEALPPAGLAELHTPDETEHRPEASHQAAADIDETSTAAHEASRAEPRPIELTMPDAQAESHPDLHPEPQAPAVEAQAPAAPAEPAVPPLHEPAVSGDQATPAVPPEQKVAMPHLEVPQEFPKSALDALGGLDMPLPPRIETPEPMPGVPLSTEPVATPETTARQALPFAQPPVPPAGEAIEAGITGAGSIAGLGAPRFGALTLDFDLNLPSDSAEPLPVFTPEQLSRIARNKLDLAHEYIALGDLSGARALINEVIESNDHATRADAQALLSTLSPLS